MTDEQLVAYMDAAQERSEAEAANAIETARMGWIFAQPAAQKQYDRWRSAIAARTGQEQPGRTLTQLARDLGGRIEGVQVERGGFEFRKDEPIQ